MGIKHLKMLLSQICKNSGIHYFATVNDFLKSEKTRIYKENVKNINNPIKQLQLKKAIENKPYFIGIDACLYAARYKRVFRRIEFGFLRQIIMSLSSKIIPIYIFDGNAPNEKRKTITNRQNKKQKIRNKLDNFLLSNGKIKSDNVENISNLSLEELINYINNIQNNITEGDFNEKKTESNYLLYDNGDISNEYNEFVRLAKKSTGMDYEDIKNLKKFLDMLKIPYLTANKEADDLMALLYKKGIIQACQSDDMDMLPKGCSNVIQISNKGIHQYLLPEILKELNLNHDQFIDMCVLLGSDYYTSYLPKIKPFDLYNKFKSNPNLENFIKIYSIDDPKIESHLENYQVAKKSFINLTEEINTNILDRKIYPFNFDNINEYLNNIGIYLDNNQYNKFSSLIKNVNCFVSSINDNLSTYINK